MITVHHLNNSRSHRILWLLEELGLDYDVVKYERDPQTRLAPASLKEVHPLGKAPVIDDDGVRVAESGAIIEYVLHRYGEGRLRPKDTEPHYIAYLQWMHFAEGSAMLPLLLGLYVGRLGEAGAPLHPRINGEIANHLGYMDRALEGREYFLGFDFSGADIQMSFPAEVAAARHLLLPYENLAAFVDRVRARPAYKRAVERGGPFKLG